MCSGSIGTYYQDVDGDGYGNPAVSVPPCSTIPPGYVPLAGDCNDGDPAVHPGATEQRNGLDDDCNGQIDDALRITCSPDVTRECPARQTTGSSVGISATCATPVPSSIWGPSLRRSM
jgi:putative metal-binding protein